MSSVSDLVTTAGHLLTARFGFEVGLGDVASLESENSVVRARLTPSRHEIPDSVIIKHVSNVEFDRPDHKGPPSRFLNEWATLDFLTGLRAGVAPNLITADPDSRLLVLEDLGDRANVETLLFDDDESAAERGLTEMGRLLGELHSVARGREEEFRSYQSGLGTRSPFSDSTMDQRGRRELFESALETMGVDPGDRFWNEVVDIEALIHERSPFRSLIHADAGPHNVLIVDEGSRLIDFEFAVYGNPLCDMVGARLGFPQTMAAGRVPREAAEALEAAYRRALSQAIPEVEEDSVFHRHLTAATGHWALNRWAYAWRTYLKPVEAGERPTHAGVKAMASLLLVFDGFVESARNFGEFNIVADALDGFTEAATTRWPGLEPSPVYPALRNL